MAKDAPAQPPVFKNIRIGFTSLPVKNEATCSAAACVTSIMRTSIPESIFEFRLFSLDQPIDV